MDLVFEWDPRKDQANLEKHRITFSEATSVFAHPLARIFADEGHSADQQREIIIGHSQAKRLLLVSFTEAAEGRVSGSLAPGAQPGGNSTIMKNTSRPEAKTSRSNGLQPEYRFDYTKAKPNRFANRVRPGSVAVLLDPDVAQVFQNAESVNTVLRALLSAMPGRRSRVRR
jgi:uncharacterized DUF497 family protein